MAYCSTNFKTKKELREAVKRGEVVRVYNPSGMFPVKVNGVEFVEGPWYPKPHTWYAKVQTKQGYIVKVLG